jgi:hypothetical protein
MYRYQVPTRNTITSSVVDRPDPTFHFDAGIRIGKPGCRSRSGKMMRIHPQHDNKLRENKTKAKGIRIDEGKRGKRVTGEKKIKRRREESRQYGWRLMLL